MGQRVIEDGIYEPDGPSEPFVDEGKQGGPERCDGTRPSKDLITAIDADSIAGRWIRIAGYIGHSPADVPSRVRRSRHARLCL